MTLDLPSSKLKEDQQWVKNIVKLANKGTQKQAKKQRQEREKSIKQKEKERKEMDSDKEFLHDGVVEVNDTRTLADRLHEKLESMKGERGTGKKRKGPEDDEEMKKYITIEKLNLKKRKTDNNKEDKTQVNGKGDTKDKYKKDKNNNTIEDKNKNNKYDKYDKKNDNRKQAPIYDEDGIEYPGDYYGSDDSDIDESLLSDTEMPIKPSKKSKQNKNKQFKDTSPEDEESLQFSTFDFSTGKPVPMYLSNKGPRKKNLPKLLKKAEKLQKQLLDRSDQGKEKAEKYNWDRMMKKASGEKVKDNPLLIAKKMANIKKRKKQSAIKWKARNDQVEKDKDIRFQKKTANIKAKIERKKMANLRRTIGASKLKNPPKRKGGGGGGGKSNRRPGFEGKKGSFINK